MLRNTCGLIISTVQAPKMYHLVHCLSSKAFLFQAQGEWMVLHHFKKHFSRWVKMTKINISVIPQWPLFIIFSGKCCALQHTYLLWLTVHFLQNVVNKTLWIPLTVSWEKGSSHSGSINISGAIETSTDTSSLEYSHPPPLVWMAWTRFKCNGRKNIINNSCTYPVA